MTRTQLVERLAARIPRAQAERIADGVDGLRARELYYTLHALRRFAADSCAAEDAADVAAYKAEREREVREQLDLEAHGDR